MVGVFTYIVAGDADIEYPIFHTRMRLLCVCVLRSFTSYPDVLPNLCGELADSIVTLAAASCVLELLARSSIVASFGPAIDIGITTSSLRYAIFTAYLTKRSQEINCVLHDRVATNP